MSGNGQAFDSCYARGGRVLSGSSISEGLFHGSNRFFTGRIVSKVIQTHDTRDI